MNSITGDDRQSAIFVIAIQRFIAHFPVIFIQLKPEIFDVPASLYRPNIDPLKCLCLFMKHIFDQ